VPPAPVKAFVSIGDKLAIMFDAPSMRANKIFIISAYTPLEILVKLDKLTKVRDAEGTVGWVENSTLGERRHVQISAASADVRAAGAATAALVFEAQRSVVLEVTGPAQDGWLPVKHRDGQSGFVRLTQVWGD
jgi:SH3-like domain-containing protein